MRPDPSILPTQIVPCNPRYPSYYPKTSNGSCAYYENLKFVCGMGGFTKPTEPDQIWRFATPVFLHTGVIHLVINMVIQIRTGFQMERQMGSLRMAIVYLTCGVAGNLFASAMAPKDGNHSNFSI